MENDHVEIHDPIANNDLASSNSDPTSQTASMDDTVEFKLLMVYSQRRRPDRLPELQGPGETDPPSAQTAESDQEVKEGEEKRKKKKKRRGAKGLMKMFSCIKPSMKSYEPSDAASDAPEPEFKCGAILHEGRLSALSNNADEPDELVEVAGVLTEIASEIPFTPPQIETDTGIIDDVDKVVALLLREAGDKLDQEMKDAHIAAEFFRNYSFFESVMKTLQSKMGLMSSEADHLGAQASPKAQIAVTCEATCRLLTLTSVPARRMLGYGARYLQDYFSVWVTENGGYVEAFHNDDEDEVE